MNRKVVSWNIRHGGGRRVQAVADRLLDFDADLLVITEFRLGPSGTHLCSRLAAAGYHLTHPAVAVGVNTVLVASRSPISGARPLDPDLPDERHLWLVDIGWLELCATYMPLDERKRPYWRTLREIPTRHPNLSLVIGDFNTGDDTLDKTPEGTRFACADEFASFARGGFVDVWRQRNPSIREYTWFSQRANNGFRIDHAFVAEKAAVSVVECRYDHMPRKAALSDHSALVLVCSDQAGDRPRHAPNLIDSHPAHTVGGSVIYVLRDPARPELVKIGKDTNWPQRFRQACSHSPRPFEIVGLWPMKGFEPQRLAQAERKAHELFVRADDNDGREWFLADTRQVVRQLTQLLGCTSVVPAMPPLKPFDDWRDWAQPRTSRSQRRLWVGQEGTTGRLKLVHSPHVDLFFKMCPTYNCFGLRWIGVWVVEGMEWQPSETLNEPDRYIVSTWEALVQRYGFGIHDPRVGWLTEDVTASFVCEELRERGLAEIDPRGLLGRQTIGQFVEIAGSIM